MNFDFKKNKSESKTQQDYARVLKNLMYNMSCARLDIAYTISKLSRCTSNPDYNHWIAMKQVWGT